MIRLSVSLLWLALSAGTQAQQQALVSQRQPVVVYDGQSTLVASPFYQRMARGDAPSSRVNARHAAGVRPLIQQLPLSTAALRVGLPTVKRQAGQVVPLFVMGMDRVSLRWFEEAAPGLARLGARGVVVQAERRHDWQALQQRARQLGIELMLLPGDSLAAGYQLETYPVVIVSPAQAGADE